MKKYFGSLPFYRQALMIGVPVMLQSLIQSQVSLVDAEKHTMEVRRDGRLVTTLPITAGAPKTTTYNGKMVVTELFDVTRMNGATVGFKDKNGKEFRLTPGKTWVEVADQNCTIKY